MLTINFITCFKLALTFNTIRHTRWSIVLIPWSRLLRRFLAVLLVFNSAYFPNGLTKFIFGQIVAKRSYDRSSTCEQKSALGINTISPFIIDKSTLVSNLIYRAHAPKLNPLAKISQNHSSPLVCDHS